MNSLFERLLSTPEVMEALSDRRFVEAMLHFEAALARAQASVGLIPQTASVSIVGTCKVELFDVQKLVREAGCARSATQPLIKNLRETVGLFNREAEPYVHFACCDQDLADAALVLVTRDALDLITADLSQVLQRLHSLADNHVATPMLSHSASQASSLTSFGLTCAQWAAPLQRAQRRLGLAADQFLCLPFTGLLGTSADLQGQGPQVLAHMASELKLKAPALPGPTERDEWLALASALALLVASLARLAQDLLCQAQAEVAELSLPQDNCAVALAAAQRAPQRLAALLATLAQAPADAADPWQAAFAEWTALLMATHAPTRAMSQALAGLQVHPERMTQRLLARRSAAATREAAAPLAPQQIHWVAELAHQHIRGLHASAES